MTAVVIQKNHSGKSLSVIICFGLNLFTLAQAQHSHFTNVILSGLIPYCLPHQLLIWSLFPHLIQACISIKILFAIPHGYLITVSYPVCALPPAIPCVDIMRSVLGKLPTQQVYCS